MTLRDRLRKLHCDGSLELPAPGQGSTADRHRKLAAIAREDLSLARLAEAHADAVAILAEAGRKPEPGALYGVWASEAPHQALQLLPTQSGYVVNGTKMFCTGAGLLDRALITALKPEEQLIDLNLRPDAGSIEFDGSSWISTAFSETNTATATFVNVPVQQKDLVGGTGWYVGRPGFWHGACGPASCWAGGAMGLLDYALAQNRKDPHTMAHLGAMHANAWALAAYLDSAGLEIDADPLDGGRARIRALTARHLIEQACTDMLRRFARAYGPRPLAFEAAPSARYQELDLYVRQSHAERDLEALGRSLTAARD